MNDSTEILIKQKTIKEQIHDILENNKLEDLKKFLSRRNCLNNVNMGMTYLFHTVQAAGILTTTIATGYGATNLIWIGVGLNVGASLINIFEHTNNSMSMRLMKDIIAIRDDKYVDEGIIVEEDNKSTKEQTQPTSSRQTTTNSSTI